MSPFTLARHDQTDALSVDRLLRGLARLGLRHLRRTAVQFRGAQRHPHLVRPADRRRPKRSAALPYWTGILNSLLLLGWAAGGVILRAHLRPLRPQARAHDHDGALRARHRLLRLRHRDVAARHLPHRREPRHRRRMGGRLRHGRGSGARGKARRSRRVAVHLGAVRPVPRDVRERARWRATGSPTTRPCPGATCCCSACCRPASHSSCACSSTSRSAGPATAANAAPARVREIFAPDMRARTISALIVTSSRSSPGGPATPSSRLANSLAGAEAVSARPGRRAPPRRSSRAG